MASGYYEIETQRLVIDNLLLVETAKESGKTVRQNSDDLRRGNEIAGMMHFWLRDKQVAFAEIPSGAQSAAAAKALGISTGILSTVGAVGAFKGRLIQVTPAEVKKLATGSKVGSKEEMIEWAVKHWPDAPWPRVKKTGAIIAGKAEHLADACGAIHAGIQTDQFKQLVQLVSQFSE